MESQPATATGTPATSQGNKPAAKPSPGKPRGWRKWLYRLLAFTLVPALLFGLLEGVLWICGYGYPTAFFLKDPTAAKADRYVENHEFGRRFFPPGLSREPLPALLSEVKARGTCRIFIMGESAALGFPDPSSSFARILAVLLSERYPDTRFEVVNTGMVAINSHVILPLARDCAQQHPDLFIVYLGNNEVVGPFGAAGVIGPYAPNLGIIRANLFLKTTRTGQLLHSCFQGLGASRNTPRSWKGMSMFLQSQMRADDPRLAVTYDHLRDNLKEICSAGVGAGARVIVCTIPVNLRDLAPFASLHAADLSAEQLKEWESLYADGARLEEVGQFTAALDRYQEASRIDNHFADLEFRLGRCFAATGAPEKAREHWLRARELDTLRFRADARINETIRQVASSKATEGVHLVDAESIFTNAAPGHAPGEEFFFEHVHMTFSGNYLLARSLLEKVTEVLPASVKGRGEKPGVLTEEQCAERLAHTEWTRLKLITLIQQLLQQPPFNNQSDHVKRDARWHLKGMSSRAQVSTIVSALGQAGGMCQLWPLGWRAETMLKAHDHLSPESLRTAVAVYQRAIDQAKNDWMLRMNFAQLLLECGDPQGAAAQYETILQQDPHLFTAHIRWGDLLFYSRAYKAAGDHYQAALKTYPGSVEARYGLARVLAANGKFEEAHAIHEKQLRTAPDRAEALEKLGVFLYENNKTEEARLRFEEALGVDPDNANVHAHLGALQFKLGFRQEAVRYYEKALRLRPGWPEVVQRLAELQAGQSKEGARNN